MVFYWRGVRAFARRGAYGVPVNWDEIEFFKKNEFDCKCGCGGNEMVPSFLKKLDHTRRLLGFPFVVTSGYRCPQHNNRVSNTGLNGPHTTGRAVDVQLFGHRAFVLLRAIGVGNEFTGIGLNLKGPHKSRFIHLDDLESHDNRFRPTVWTY